MKARYPGACTPRERTGSDLAATAGGGEGEEGEERRTRWRRNRWRKRLMYFAPGDLVFSGRPREYHRRFTADGVHVYCGCAPFNAERWREKRERILSGTADLS